MEEEELTEQEKMLAEVVALQIIRINHLSKAVKILEKAYIAKSELTDEEAELIDKVRD